MSTPHDDIDAAFAAARQRQAAADRIAASTAKLAGRLARCEAANKLIEAIASCGRRFFAHEGRIGRFEIDGRGRVWFVDAYTQKRIYTHYHYNWRGFTEGGTLRALCEALRDFIGKAKSLNPGYFGPWPKWICDGDLWGYGEAIASVRLAAEQLGVTRPKEAS